MAPVVIYIDECDQVTFLFFFLLSVLAMFFLTWLSSPSSSIVSGLGIFFGDFRLWYECTLQVLLLVRMLVGVCCVCLHDLLCSPLLAPATFGRKKKRRLFDRCFFCHS